MKIFDTVSALLSREVYDADWFSSTNQRMLDLGLVAAQTVCPATALSVRITETRNKLYAFGCFCSSGSLAAKTGHEPADWHRALGEIRGRDSFTAIWQMEGVAHRMADEYWSATSRSPLLRGWTSDSFSHADLPLHTGAGLSLCMRILTENGAYSQEPRLEEMVNQVGRLAHESASPNYGECILEALGLVVRNLFPQFLLPLGARLSAAFPLAWSLFWHGAGRGLYFDPLHLCPAMSHWSLEEAVANAPGVEAQANLVSGFFWAMTLVNVRHPEVVTQFLCNLPASQCARHAGPISDGTSAALLVWHHLTSDQRTSERFLGYLPVGAPAGLRRFWEDQIVGHARWRLAHQYERLRREEKMAGIFRFQAR